MNNLNSYQSEIPYNEQTSALWNIIFMIGLLYFADNKECHTEFTVWHENHNIIFYPIGVIRFTPAGEALVSATPLGPPDGTA